ncbi:hypothetical protein B0H10DRAFT_87383 [Mycena sp. CBHHK59/15]|nr:hypothetical protein B0H10DRAFT_87383 [Mycena sp. CBHHK59/15]
MFEPFENASQFYPGLILWCDPNCYEMDMSTLSPNTPYDRKKSRELKPCLVVNVDYTRQCFQVARLSATTPTDTTRWVKIDSPPSITWKLNDAWIWVATPPTVGMVFDQAKVMHPNKDAYYSVNPIASTNLQNYWVHRHGYINKQMRGRTVRSNNSTYVNNNINPYYTQLPSTPGANYPSQANQYTPSGYLPTQEIYSSGPSNQLANSAHSQSPGFNTLSPQPVVVPPGFTETNQRSPGWWRNPETGWFWHASHGLLPPSSPSSSK